MIRLWFLTFIFLPCLLTAQTPLEKAVVMPLKDVRPGMRGKIYTVFQGSNIESFNAEVVGVLDNFIGPGVDLILCKLPDAKTWNSGAVAGMSGSPMYIDGKLVGALGYGLQIFETERYCGITPIQPMLDVFKFDTPATNAWNRTTHVLLADGKSADFSGLQRLSIPLSVGGVPSPVIELYAPLFKKYGLSAAQASTGGGSVEKRIEAPFIPGAAVSGVLVRGDMSISGTGTLTYRDGNRVLAFGHPFFEMGAVEMPMAQAEIVSILPSLMRSFKVANLRQNIGTITQDRLTAIGGIIGPSPETIPVSITTIDPKYGKKTYQYEVTQIEEITPMLLSLVLASSATRVMDYSKQFTIRMKGKAVFEGKPPLDFKDTYSGEESERLMMIMDASFKLSALLTNPFEKPRLQSLEMEWDSLPVKKVSSLEGISVSKRSVRPGETIELSYTIRPWRSEPLTKKISVKIPEEIKAGELVLQLCDAATINNQSPVISLLFMVMGDESTSTSEKIERGLHPTRLFAKGENPVNTKQLIDLFNKQVPQDAYYLRLIQNAPGIVVEDKTSENLPASIISLYQDTKINQPVAFIDQVELSRQALPQDGVALGTKSVKLQVINR